MWPAFFANLGDFAGPPRVGRRPRPARNFQFACAGTRFVAIDGASGQAGPLGDTATPDTAGPGPEALELLDESLAAAPEPHRVVLLHAPPHLGGHYAPQPECGFLQGEAEFLEILRRHGVRRVCCAHGLGYDHHVHDGIRFVMSGGGGAALDPAPRRRTRSAIDDARSPERDDPARRLREVRDGGGSIGGRRTVIGIPFIVMSMVVQRCVTTSESLPPLRPRRSAANGTELVKPVAHQSPWHMTAPLASWWTNTPPAATVLEVASNAPAPVTLIQSPGAPIMPPPGEAAVAAATVNP